MYVSITSTSSRQPFLRRGRFPGSSGSTIIFATRFVIGRSERLFAAESRLVFEELEFAFFFLTCFDLVIEEVSDRAFLTFDLPLVLLASERPGFCLMTQPPQIHRAH